MIYFVFDNYFERSKKSVFENNNFFSCKTIYPKKYIKKPIAILKYCFNIAFSTKKNDTLIFWYDFIGILTTLICMITFKKRKIIILNILLKNKNDFLHKMLKCMYKLVLSLNNVTYTVTSKEYGVFLIKYLNIKKECILLHDIYEYENYNIEKKNDENYVFCGGRNGRDWELIFKIANNTPKISYHFVMPKALYELYKDKQNSNIKILVDINKDEFSNEIFNCSFVAMPLLHDAPSGLLVFFQATSFNKLIVSSDTMTNREYFSKDRGILLENNVDIWIRAIENISNKLDEYDDYVKNCKQFLSNYCGYDSYFKILKNLL